jgi:hypothetical protein
VDLSRFCLVFDAYGTLSAKAMRPDPGSIRFVSSNFFEVAGAKVFRFKSYWVNRSAIPVEELGVRPNAILEPLTSSRNNCARTFGNLRPSDPIFPNGLLSVVPVIAEATEIFFPVRE